MVYFNNVPMAFRCLVLVADTASVKQFLHKIGPRHSQYKQFLHNIGPGPGACPGHSQYDYTIKVCLH